MTGPIEITDDNFDEIIQKNPVVMVDFSADWCGPCKVIEPVIHELAEEYSGRVVVGELDVDKNQQTAVRFGVMSIPTILVFKDGNLASNTLGAVRKERLVERLEEVL